jgi:photosystem II stability/assembly factor-like uncharacterized protein
MSLVLWQSSGRSNWKKEVVESMKLKLFILVSVLLVAAASFAKDDTPAVYLVKVDVVQREDVGTLLGYGINVVQDLGEFVLARVGISDIGMLTSAGFSVLILDSNCACSDYYIVSLKKCANPSSMGKVVYSDSDLAIVGRSMFIPAVIAGCDAKKVRTSAMKVRGQGTGIQGLAPDTLPDPVVEEMVDSVSSDTIEEYIRSLQDIGTRYSAAPGCSLAAEYLKAQMEAAGITAELKPYYVPGMVYDLCCITDSLTWAVDEVGGISKSLDGGVTWEEKFRSTHGLTGICFLDSLTGWAVGGSDVFHTTDGGNAWPVQNSTDVFASFRCTFLDSQHGWVSGVSPDTTPAVYKTVDGGANWTCYGPTFFGEFLGISFVDTLKGWAVGTNYDIGSGIIYGTTDGGVTWAELLDTMDVILFDVDFATPLKGWAVGGDASSGAAIVLATTDGGQTWSQQVTGGWFLGSVDFADSLNGWCAGYGTLKHTTNGGSTWASQSPPAVLFAIAMDMFDTLHGVFGGSDGTVCGTFNGGSIWFASNTGTGFLWYNVEGVLPGVDMPGQTVIVCAHHDDTSEDPMNVAPGADDNASGSAGVIETARVLASHQFHRTIRFVTFSGEEQGLLGSAAYANKADSLGDTITAVVNLDMISYLDDTSHDLDVYCDMASQWLADTILKFSSAYVPELAPYKELDPSMVYSDHASFWDVGYPAVLNIEREFTSSNPYYHTTGDTAGTLTMSFATEMVKLALASTAELADPYVVGVQEREASENRPAVLSLDVAGNNPFSDEVVLRVINPSQEKASLRIYDSSGRLLRGFVPFETAEKTLSWDGSTDRGGRVSSGVYFAKLQSKAGSVARELIFVK